MTTSVRHETSPVDSAQNHERLTVAESIETGVPVETFLGVEVSCWGLESNVFEQFGVHMLRCRLAREAWERRGRGAQESPLPRRGCFALTAGDDGTLIMTSTCKNLQHGPVLSKLQDTGNSRSQVFERQAKRREKSAKVRHQTPSLGKEYWATDNPQINTCKSYSGNVCFCSRSL